MKRLTILNYLLSFATAGAVWYSTSTRYEGWNFSSESILHIPFLIISAIITAHWLKQKVNTWALKRPTLAVVKATLVHGLIASWVTCFVGYKAPEQWDHSAVKNFIQTCLYPITLQVFFFPLTILYLVLFGIVFGYLFKRTLAQP